MIQNTGKKIFFPLLTGSLFLLLSTIHASAQCVSGQITIEELTIAPSAYDPLSPTDTLVAISSRVQNLGASCTYHRYFCVSTADTRLEGTSSFLPFSLSFSGSTGSIVNSNQATGCPPTSVGLSNSQHRSLPVGQSHTDMTSVHMVIPNSTFAKAGSYSETDMLELAIYDSSTGQKLHSKSLTPMVSVDQACELPNFPTSSTGNKATYISAGGGIDGGSIDFSNAISSTTATIGNANMTLNYQGTRCNYRSYVSVISANGGMTQQSGASAVSGSGAFLDRVDYTAQASFCGTSTQLTTTGIAGISTNSQCSIDGINQSDLSVSVSTTQNNTPLLAGQFADILTVQIGSQL